MARPGLEPGTPRFSGRPEGFVMSRASWRSACKPRCCGSAGAALLSGRFGACCLRRVYAPRRCSRGEAWGREADETAAPCPTSRRARAPYLGVAETPREAFDVVDVFRVQLRIAGQTRLSAGAAME